MKKILQQHLRSPLQSMVILNDTRLDLLSKVSLRRMLSTTKISFSCLKKGLTKNYY